jgi:hypothetical protein
MFFHNLFIISGIAVTGREFRFPVLPLSPPAAGNSCPWFFRFPAGSREFLFLVLPLSRLRQGISVLCSDSRLFNQIYIPAFLQKSLQLLIEAHYCSYY